MDRLDVPDLNRHEWRSKSFFWAADSQSVVSADSVGNNLSLVLAVINHDKPQAYTHAVSSDEICSGSVRGEPYLVLGNATIAVSELGPSVLASFDDLSGDSLCQPRQLNLPFDSFQPAKVERYEHRRLKEPVPDGKAH
jgi:hypothetical protein